MEQKTVVYKGMELEKHKAVRVVFGPVCRHMNLKGGLGPD